MYESSGIVTTAVEHWDDKTLVADTSRINWPRFDRPGAPQTENVAINERFADAESGDRLDHVMTVNEPASLVELFWKPSEPINH